MSHLHVVYIDGECQGKFTNEDWAEQAVSLFVQSGLYDDSYIEIVHEPIAASEDEAKQIFKRIKKQLKEKDYASK